MIPRKVITIHLKEGETAKLLLTPALYGVAKERGIDITGMPAEGQDRKTHVFDQYAKIAYCAAISAWEVDGVDDPDQGPFPYTFEDFAIWAYSEQAEFGRTINDILQALTGKSVREYLREAGESEKKKSSQQKETLWSRLITRRSKRSS